MRHTMMSSPRLKGVLLVWLAGPFCKCFQPVGRSVRLSVVKTFFELQLLIVNIQVALRETWYHGLCSPSARFVAARLRLRENDLWDFQDLKIIFSAIIRTDRRCAPFESIRARPLGSAPE